MTFAVDQIVSGVAINILAVGLTQFLAAELFTGLFVAVALIVVLVLARLQSFDPGLEEAALDLGANHGQVLRRILLPHLYPAIAASSAMAGAETAATAAIIIRARFMDVSSWVKAKSSPDRFYPAPTA